MAAVGTYPVHVDASLDAPLSRWLWLVKWILLIPHYFVLAFLWVAFVLLSVVAFAAILITGTYPRPIFEFNVGVLRWTWRVQYYSIGAFGTDRYPRSHSPKTRRIRRTWRSPTLAACRVVWRWSSGGYWPSRNTWSSACSPAAGSGWPHGRATPGTSTRPAAGGSSVSWR